MPGTIRPDPVMPEYRARLTRRSVILAIGLFVFLASALFTFLTIDEGKEDQREVRRYGEDLVCVYNVTDDVVEGCTRG